MRLSEQVPGLLWSWELAAGSWLQMLRLREVTTLCLSLCARRLGIAGLRFDTADWWGPISGTFHFRRPPVARDEMVLAIRQRTAGQGQSKSKRNGKTVRRRATMRPMQLARRRELTVPSFPLLRESLAPTHRRSTIPSTEINRTATGESQNWTATQIVAWPPCLAPREPWCWCLVRR